MNAGSAILLAFALVSYILVALAVFRQIGGRSVRRSLQADSLWLKSWNHDVLDVKHALVADIAEAYKHNKLAMLDKGAVLMWTLRFVVAEVIFVGGSLLANRLL